MTYHNIHKPKFIKFFINMRNKKGKLYKDELHDYLKDQEDLD